MTIYFLGTPLESFERLIKEEEKVTITISCFKQEPLYTANTDIDGSATMEMEEVLTAQWGQQIKNIEQIFSFDGDSAKVYAIDLNKRMELVN